MFEVKLDFTKVKTELKTLKARKVEKEIKDAAADKMLKHIHSKAPKKTGKFISSFKRRNTKTGVNLETKYADLFEWLEFTGTQAHVIRPVKAQVLHWLDPDTGEDVFRMKVNHPGFKHKPFARPGLAKTTPSATDHVLKAIKRDHKWMH